MCDHIVYISSHHSIIEACHTHVTKALLILTSLRQVKLHSVRNKQQTTCNSPEKYKKVFSKQRKLEAENGTHLNYHPDKKTGRHRIHKASITGNSSGQT